MSVTGPAGILAFYILSALRFPGFFHEKKPSTLLGSKALMKYVVICLCLAAVFLLFRHVYQFFNKKMKPVFPAEQIVMDVKRLNINFTFMEKDKIDSKP